MLAHTTRHPATAAASRLPSWRGGGCCHRTGCPRRCRTSLWHCTTMCGGARTGVPCAAAIVCQVNEMLCIATRSAKPLHRGRSEDAGCQYTSRTVIFAKTKPSQKRSCAAMCSCLHLFSGACV